MSILLTHGYFLNEDEVEQQIMKPYPPLGLLYISAFLEEHQVNHHVLDSTFSSEKKWFDFVKEHQPKVIAFYTNLMTKVKILSIVKKLKSEEKLKDIKILLGGPDLTYNSENYLKYGADFLIIGEGEETFLEFSQQFIGKQEFETVDGLIFKGENGELIKNEPRKKIREVDSLPFPNRAKIDLSLYLDTWKKYHGKSTLNISTQRGCPYTCQWCSTAVYGQSYRRRSPKLVVDEIEYLIKEYNPDALWFVDDVFTVSHKWIAAFSEEMKSRGISIPFECITRAERMNETILQQLKEAGCFRIWIGAESGSQRIIDLMKRQVNIDKVRDMMLLTQQYEIEAGTFIMVGYPTETKEDIKLTIDYLKAANPSQFTITVAYPIKGTGLYNQIKEIITEQPQWNVSTDRQIDFKRTYSRKYYDFAVRKIVNEVHFNKEKLGGKTLSKKAITHKLKSLVSGVQMILNQ